MGVKKLNSFILEKKMVNIYKSTNEFIKNNSNNKVYILAIDVLLFAHKFKYSINNIIQGFYNLIIKLLLNNIIPIPVFDGKSPNEKKNLILHRISKKNKIKQKILLLEQQLQNNIDSNNKKLIIEQINKLNKNIINVSKNDIQDLKLLFTLFNIPYLNATGEADYMCAKLYKENKINGCLSDDMDILAHGCNKLIKINGKQIIEYDLEYILKNLNINYFQFIDMCILFGCDYTKSIPYIHPNLSYSLIKSYGNIDKIIDNFINNNKKYETFIKNYKFARKIFITSSDNEIIPSDFEPNIKNMINLEKIIKFLKKKNCKISYNNLIKYNNDLNKINNLIKINHFSKNNNIINKKY